MLGKARGYETTCFRIAHRGDGAPCHCYEQTISVYKSFNSFQAFRKRLSTIRTEAARESWSSCGAFKSHIELTTDFSQIHRGQLTSCLPSHRKEISHTVSGHLVAVLLTEISTCAAASATCPQLGRRIAGLTATSILLRTSARQKPWLGWVGKKASTFDAFFATSKAFSPRACPLSASGGLGWLWSVQFFVVSLLAFSASNWPLGLE